MTAPETQPQAEAPKYTPLSQTDPAELSRALEEAGVPMEKEPDASTPAPDPVAAKPPAPAEAKPADDGLPTLLKLARDRDSQRKLMEQKEIEAAKPYVDALKVIPPHTAQAIAKAIASGDPMSLLAAAGMTHSQYEARMKGGAPQAEETEPVDEVKTIKQELEALKKERESERLQQSRSQMLGQMKNILKDDPKFQTINGLADYEGVENVLIRYHSQHGQLPGNTLEESVQLAAELYEYELRQHAEKFRPFLTAQSKPAMVQEKRAPETLPEAGSVGPRTLTNANTSAPAAPRTLPKTREEIIQALIEGREDDLE